MPVKEENGSFTSLLFEEDSNLGSPITVEEMDSSSLQILSYEANEPAPEEWDSSMEENCNSSPSIYLQPTTEPHAVELEPLPFDDLEYALQPKSHPPPSSLEDRHCSYLPDSNGMERDLGGTHIAC